MIHQLDYDGKDKVEVAIERIQSFAEMFSPGESYLVAFSGGKDSVVVKRLCEMAGVPFDAHYAVTSVDPPELVRFIRKHHPDVIFDQQRYKKDGTFVKAGDRITMLNLIPEKMIPPTRIGRYCCEYLKETTGDGRLTITGVRKAESVNRKNNQGLITVYKNGKQTDELIESGFFAPTIRGGWYW